MKVYDHNSAGVTPTESGKTQDTQRVERETSSRSTSSRVSGSGDRVELSLLAGRVSQALARSSAARASHVEALGEAYRSGQYRPDALATSRGMVADALAAGAAE